MCGIVGVVHPSEARPVQTDVLLQMLGMIRHRGPDEAGIYTDERAGLGSVRLSIIDLKTGQQPISNEDESLWIVFNGEIFNYPELRRGLLARGHRFRTETDTEVVLHLYEELGPECLNDLNGQFAIAIWDSRRQVLFLARDRVGIRPLFYTRRGHMMIFGSEMKAILAYPGVQAEIDPLAMDQIFTFWSTLSPRTIFREILELPAGHYLLMDKEGLSVHRYYELRFPAKAATGGERCQDTQGNGHARDLSTCVETFRDLLMDATRIRLRADVPVGAYLSGGIDSSVVAALIREVADSRLSTFSIAFEDPRFDESEHQLRMAKHLGVSHHVVYAKNEDIGASFPAVIWHTEAPILRTSPVPLFLLSKLVQDQHFKVVLTGEGADEFLAGYHIFKEAKVRRFWAKQASSEIRPLLLRRLYPYIDGISRANDSYLRRFFGYRLTDLDAPDYSHCVRWHTTGRTKRFFSRDLRHAVEEAGEYAIAYPSGFEDWDPLHRAQYLESSIFLAQYLLSSQGDRMAMAHSVEGRFPYLDHRVMAFCNQLPPSYKLLGMTEKYLLKKVAAQWLPEDIWSRPKRPYRAPIQSSFFGSGELDYIREVLSEACLREAGLFAPASVSGMLRKASRGAPLSETDEMAFVGILSAQLVHHLFVSGFRTSPPIPRGPGLKEIHREGLESTQGSHGKSGRRTQD